MTEAQTMLFDCRVPATAIVVPAGRRKPVQMACSHRLTTGVAAVGVAEAPEAVVVQVDDGTPPIRMRAWNGSLWRRATGHRDGKTFLPVFQHHLAAMLSGQLVDAANPICLSRDPPHLEGNFKAVHDDGSAAAQAWIDDRTSRMLLVDDVLHVSVPAPERRFALQPRHHGSRQFSFTSALSWSDRISTNPWTPLGPFVVGIPAASTQMGDAFASAIEERTGIAFVASRATISFGVDAPFLHPDLLVRDVRNIFGSVGTHHGLLGNPDGAFDAWIQARHCFDAGDLGGAIRALGTMAARVPQESPFFEVLAVACLAMEMRVKVQPTDDRLLAAVEALDAFDWGKP